MATFLQKVDRPTLSSLWSLSLLVTVLISLAVARNDSTEHSLYLCVKPNTSDNCSLLHCNHCHTLDEYAQNITSYLKSNTIIEFLCGTHEMNTVLTVSDSLTNVTLRGYAEQCCTVQCNGRSNTGFVFSGINTVKIDNLAFVDCQHQINYSNVSHVALEINNVVNLSVARVTVIVSAGQGLILHNIAGDSLIVNSTFACRRETTLQHCSSNSHFIYNAENAPDIHKYSSGSYSSVYGYCRNVEVLYSHEHSRCPLVPTHLQVTNSQFQDGYDNNTYSIASGLSISISCDKIKVTLSGLTLDNNVGDKGGNMRIYITHPTSSVKVTNCIMLHGSAYEGGAMYVYIIPSRENETESSNSTCDKQIDVVRITNTTFSGNYAVESGGGIHLLYYNRPALKECNTITIEDCNFRNNSLKFLKSGAAVYRSTYISPQYALQNTPQAKTTFRNCSFVSNCNYMQDSIQTNMSTYAALFLSNDAFAKFEGTNTFIDNNCSAIGAVQSTMIFSGNTTILRNRGINGGGMVLCERSYMFLSADTKINIIANNASNVGGGIYTANSCLNSEQECFFQLVEEDHKKVHTMEVVLMDNHALMGGTALYGGSIDYCYIVAPTRYHHTLFDRIFQYPKSPHLLNTSVIASEPLRLCFCDQQHKPNCSARTMTVHITLHGDTHTVSLAVVGQRDGTVTGEVMALQNNHCPVILNQDQCLQRIDSPTCSNLSYTVFSNKTSVELKLFAQHYKSSASIIQQSTPESLTINFTFSPCPPGLTLTNHKLCNCFDLLANHNVMCEFKNNVTTFSNSDDGLPMPWIGYNGNLTFFGSCPSGYCGNAHNFTIYTTDEQCSNNHLGILCGRCRSNYSLPLGSYNNCLKCSNSHLALLIPFAVIGLLLVIFIFACQLPGTIGMLNGFLLYINVVHFSAILDQGTESTTKIFSNLIAWLNLDLGFEMCFINGMDASTRLYLQLVFPIYTWIVAGAIIGLGRISARVNQRVSGKGTRVIAVLFLLCFASLTRTFSDALHYTKLHYSDGSQKLVWLYDGNIEYLSKNSIIMSAVMLLVGLVLLGFTFLLLFHQLLLKVKLRIFNPVKKLCILATPYAALLKPHCQFWPGLLFLLRLVVITSARTYEEWAFILVPSSMVIFTIASSLQGVYEKWQYDLLEAVSLLNLVGLSLYAIADSNSATKRNAKVLSLGIAVLLFLIIVVYHGYKLLKLKKWFQCVKRFYKTRTQDQQQLLVSDQSFYDSTISTTSFNEE